MKAASVRVELSLKNYGTCPAEEIEVDLHFPDDIVIFGAEFAESKSEPTPPPRPSSLFRASAMTFNPPFIHTLDVSAFRLCNVSEPQIRKSNSYDVRYDVGTLKHETEVSLGPLFLVFPDWTCAAFSRSPFDFMPRIRRSHQVGGCT